MRFVTRRTLMTFFGTAALLAALGPPAEPGPAAPASAAPLAESAPPPAQPPASAAAPAPAQASPAATGESGSPAATELPAGTAKFASPHAGEILAGSTVIEVLVGAPAPGTTVAFFVDDAPAGTASAPPFRVTFDFGESLASRRLRAVVTDPTGRSQVLTLTTRAMGKADAYSGVDLVNLYITVRDGSGKFLRGLDQQSFSVLENGRPQTISHFSNERQRLVVGVVLDASLSMQGERIQQARESARVFLDRLEPTDRAMGLCFNQDARLVKEETSDHASVAAALAACQPVGGTALYDALYRAADRLAPIDGRKVIVLLSDGRDESAGGLEPGSLHTFEEALDRALRSEVIVYAVGVGEKLDKEMDFYGRRTVASILEELSTKTGGRVTFVRRISQLRDAFEEIDEELRWQYGLGYSSSNLRRDGTWRELRVGVDKPGARATTRAGYFAPKS